MSDARSGDKDRREPAESQVRDVTQLLRAWSEGDQRVLEKLTPLVYQELQLRHYSDTTAAQ